MASITLKNHKVSTAKRLYDILNNPNFTYFDVKPNSVEAEKKWLRANKKRMKQNVEHSYAIYYGEKLVGGCGITIDQKRKYIGEIGYFIDEPYWGKGIAVKAVKLLEKKGFNKLNLIRIVIIMDVKNKASEKVAAKCGYKKEGKMKKVLKRDNTYHDCYIYAKVK